METTPQSRIADRLRLAELASEIEGLESALVALRNEKKLVQERLDAYAYPVSTLPSEIISEIFLQYIPAYPARPPLYGDGSPEKLAQICRRWRSIAHGTPALWRAMHIPNNPPSCAATLTIQWMERSRTLPPSIRFWPDSDELTPTRSMHAVPVIESMLLFRPRWADVALRIPSALTSGSRIEGNFPILTKMAISLQYGGIFTSPTMPKLSTVYLWHASNVHRINFIPWTQLTTIFLGSTFHDVVASVLRETQSVARCHLSQINFDDEPMIQTPMRMAALETLIVNYWNPCNYDLAAALLRPLHLPRLRCLRMSDEVAEETSPRLSTLVSLIDGFGCTLDRLCIVSDTLSPQECCAAFPAIGQVEIVARESQIDAEVWGYWNREDGDE